MLGVEVVGVLLALLDEADVLQNPRILNGSLAEDTNAALAGEVLPGEQLHDGGLARTVSAEQAVDAVLLDGE